MIASDEAVRIPVRTRGGPLIMLMLLVGGWCLARVWFWQYPFAPLVSAQASDLAVGSSLPPGPLVSALLPLFMAPPLKVAEPGAEGARSASGSSSSFALAAHLHRIALPPARVSAMPAFPGASGPIPGLPPGFSLAPPAGDRNPPASAPFLPVPAAAPASEVAPASRWSVDAWAFWRQGSDAAPISQGRVPIYGASQAGAALQYRLSPASAFNPRLYARAYQALVQRGERELALGGALRPLPRVPLRVAGEVRYTDTDFGDSVRPAASVVSELPPLRLPYGTQLEIYGQAGWVGGRGSTPFADGQASLTRQLPPLGWTNDNRLRISLGAAAWGGAQRDAQRLDLGPTVRLDMTLGEVPARLTIDWRQQVAGDARPGSGVSATLSTSF